jgi:hypothetical protein
MELEENSFNDVQEFQQGADDEEAFTTSNGIDDEEASMESNDDGFPDDEEVQPVFRRLGPIR